MDVVAYRVPGWGVGELYLEGARLLWHEQPAARRTSARVDDEHPVGARMAAFFGGVPVSFDDVELDLDWCTTFQRDVAGALRRVSRGETVTYGELAALAGYPNAHRAAGTFCASNRFPLVLPCHRVVSAGGIGSYGSLGVGYKRRMLALEGVSL